MVFAEGHGSTDGNPASPLSRRPVLADAEWPAFCAKLNQVAHHLKARGVRLAFHHHMGTVVQTEAEIDRLMANTGTDVGLLLDTGHLVFAGGDPAAVARRHGARIVHVHCKDVRAAVLAEVLRDDRSFLRAVLDSVFTVPGDGSIDFTAVLRELRTAGYAGWLVVEAEQDPAKAHPLTYARLGFASLKRAATDAGFIVAP
jgi:inosose dehydratase